MKRSLTDRNRTDGGLDHGGAMSDSPELTVEAPHAQFFKRRNPGERGGDGDLSGAEMKDREVVEAARRSVDGGGRRLSWRR